MMNKPTDALKADATKTMRSEGAAPLEFASDSGSSRSGWIALGLVLVMVGWMGSGIFLPAEKAEPTAMPAAPLPVAVAVQPSVAETVTLIFGAEGQTLPDRDTSLRAEASGEVAELFVTLGSAVEEGAKIAHLHSDAAEAALTQARQEVTRTRRELENAETLLARGVATVDRVVQARSDVARAEAQLTSAEEALANMVILAPFAGRLEALEIDSGEFVQAGAEVGRIVDNSPLTVSFQVPQQSLNRLKSGQPARVGFITGEVEEGVVTFVGTSATPSTRTFRAEVSIPNTDGAIAAGISAEIAIPTAQIEAHFVTPSLVSLGPQGQLGVKTVDDADIVQFYPVQIVRAEIDGIWVTGLPDKVRLITVGQGFVNDGEIVRPQMQEASE